MQLANYPIDVFVLLLSPLHLDMLQAWIILDLDVLTASEKYCFTIDRDCM